MADLENMLLEAAGCSGAARTNKQSHAPSKRHHGSYDDDGSDSKDGYSDDDLRHAGRKLSGSQVPLKKRSKKRDDHGSDDDRQFSDGRSANEGYSSDDSDVGSDLYKDDDDREQLSKMSELDRELILSERALKKDDRKLHKQMRSRLESDKTYQSAKDTSPLAASTPLGVRSSARFADQKSAKAGALKEYRERRMMRLDSESKQKFSYQHSDSKGYSPEKRKGSAAYRSRSPSDSESRSGDEESMGGGGMDYSDEERDRTVSDIPKFEEIRRITIKRSKLAKWFMEPFFEELIVGCFVRIGIGMKDGRSIYRLCLVQNVDASDPNKRYQLENKTTYKYLNCTWGNEGSAARWQMARISDSSPSLDEFEEWRREVEKNGGRMPRRSEVKDKYDAIEKINSFIYSAETVKQMLQEKKSVSSRPLNVAAEKEKLRRKLEVALEKGDGAESERIRSRLHELETARQGPQQDKKALKLAEMNRKNRVENYRASSVRAVDRSLNPGDAGYDPFSRRWTRSKNYYAAKQEGGAVTVDGGIGKADGVNGKDSSSSGAKSLVDPTSNATAAAQVAAAGAGKLVDTKAPVDLGTETNLMHDFELPISLTLLNSFGGAYGAATAFLARKQKIEANIGCKVPEDDGRVHCLTLSLGDYKRRRGLL